MSSVNTEAVKMMADEIIRAVKSLTEDNNRSYVKHTISNYKITQDNLSSDLKIGTVNVSDELYARFAEIADLEVEHATIHTAQIDDLYATTIDTINLAADKAKIGDAEVASLTSAIASISDARVAVADISYAHVKDLSTGTLIFRDGVGGKLYVDRLAVTDANIASLTVGNLMIQGNDGTMKRIVVDSEGHVSGQTITFEGDVVFNNNSLSGTKIVESSITARELNVGSIFADQALIGAIKADNIDVGNLFAARSFAGALYTNVIENPTVIIGDEGSHNVGLATWSRTAPSDPEDGDTWVDTSVDPNVFKEYDATEEEWVEIGELSSLKSAINVTEGRIALVVDGESTQSSLVLTDKMLTAIANKVNLMADDIDLSANHTMTFNATQLSQIADDIDLSANHTMTFDATQLSAIAEDIDLSANHTMTFNTTQLTAIAEDIDLSSNHTMTFNASQLTQIADDIDLSANDTVMISSSGQISAEAAAGIDLSANDTVRITSANQITQTAVDGIDLSTNNVLVSVSNVADTAMINAGSAQDTADAAQSSANIANDGVFAINNTLDAWFQFAPDGLHISQAGSIYYTLTDSLGYHVMRTDMAKPVGSFAENYFSAQRMIIGNLQVKATSKGGWAWSKKRGN